MTKRQRFWIGLVLTWAPWLPVLAVFAAALSRPKALGLGAVAGGLGFSAGGAAFIAPVAAIVALLLLCRSFERGHWGKATAAVVSIVWNSLTLAVFGFFVWFMVARPRF